METTLITSLVAILGLMASFLFVVRPLWGSPGKERRWHTSTIWSEWLDRKATLLFNLEDLAHERDLGKIAPEDYSRLEISYKKELVALLDEMENCTPPADFERFLLASEIASPSARNDNKACFRCQAFYESTYDFCPQCGSPLKASS